MFRGIHVMVPKRLQSTVVPAIPVGGLATAEATRASLSPKVASLLKDYSSLITLPVQWGEQDCYGHLNNVHYLRYFESARLAHFEQLGAKYLTPEQTASFVKAPDSKTIGPIVKSVSFNYRKVVDYPDTVTVGIKADSSTLGQVDRFGQTCVIVSHKLEAVVADGRATVVAYDYGRHVKAAVPVFVRHALESETRENTREEQSKL
ncbi:HotDog domain-containing protein [Obelidium mucronatum]|nr:HotDog domain-containing protein [Obelidium mucronatum]